MLYSCIGEEAQEVIEGLHFEEGEDKNTDVVLEKFETFCVGATNE